MRKLLGIAVLLLVSLFAFAGCGSYASQSDMENTQASVSSLEQKIADLQSKIDAMQAQLDALSGGDNVVVIDNTTVIQIQADITLLQSQVLNLQTQLSLLEGTVGSQDERITALEAQLLTVQGLVADLGNRLTALEAYVAGLRSCDCEGGGSCDCGDNCPGCSGDRPDGGPAYVFSGSGSPTSTEGARLGDLYIDLTANNNGRHNVWMYNGTAWVAFGEIFAVTGSPRPSAALRVF